MYQGRYFNRLCVNLCGDYMDGEVYPVFQSPGKRRKRCKPTSLIQEKLNQRNAEKRLTRLVHNNFTEEDMALHLTYRSGEEPATAEDAQRDLDNYIRRIKRRYKKLGIEMKYIRCTEYGKRGGRVHHHMILTGGLDRDELERLWGKGYANSKRLQFEKDGVTGLAHYVAKDKTFFKRWIPSRNLKQPEPTIQDGKITGADINALRDAIEERRAWQLFEAMYPGFELVDARCEQNGVNHGWYIHFEMRRKKEHRPHRGGCRAAIN